MQRLPPLRETVPSAGGRRSPTVIVAAAIGALLAVAAVGGRADGPDAADAVRKASAAYATAFNARDFATLADHWAEQAELTEGGGMLVGRAAISASIRSWLERHPRATLEIEVDGVQLVAAPLARVSGVMRFRSDPDGAPAASRFESLRVLENGVWRLVESRVAACQAAALAELDWLVGTWHAGEGPDGPLVVTTFEQPLGGYALVGRTRAKPPGGTAIEALEVIHADRDSGRIRSWVFDSTGARAEGLLERDGVTWHQTLVGTPADGVTGSVSRWTRMITPAGGDRMTVHSIDRTVDGTALPDRPPLHFRKLKTR